MKLAFWLRMHASYSLHGLNPVLVGFRLMTLDISWCGVMAKARPEVVGLRLSFQDSLAVVRGVLSI